MLFIRRLGEGAIFILEIIHIFIKPSYLEWNFQIVDSTAKCGLVERCQVYLLLSGISWTVCVQLYCIVGVSLRIRQSWWDIVLNLSVGEGAEYCSIHLQSCTLPVNTVVYTAYWLCAMNSLSIQYKLQWEVVEYTT